MAMTQTERNLLEFANLALENHTTRQFLQEHKATRRPLQETRYSPIMHTTATNSVYNRPLTHTQRFIQESIQHDNLASLADRTMPLDLPNGVDIGRLVDAFAELWTEMDTPGWQS